jgi:hypothetical protein
MPTEEEPVYEDECAVCSAHSAITSAVSGLSGGFADSRVRYESKPHEHRAGFLYRQKFLSVKCGCQ